MTQSNSAINTNLIIALSNEKYNLFCQKLKKIISMPTLEIFKNKEICDISTKNCKELFSEEISAIKSLVNDPAIGIASLDIPQTDILDSTTDTIASAAVALGIFNSIGTSTIDPLNFTPFTLHSASHTNAKLLSSTEYTPDAKLGFHNDGLVSEGKIELPKHIMLYNLYLGYREPGNFRWVPTAQWSDREYFTQKIQHDRLSIKMKPTPHLNLHKNLGLQTTELADIEIPISNKNKDGKIQFFLNGKISPSETRQENIQFITAMKKSLENNSTHICIPQKERRAIFLNNTNGFHARDIFKDPIEGVDLTRVFLRSVDSNAEQYPSTNIMLK